MNHRMKKILVLMKLEKRDTWTIDYEFYNIKNTWETDPLRMCCDYCRLNSISSVDNFWFNELMCPCYLWLCNISYRSHISHYLMPCHDCPSSVIVENHLICQSLFTYSCSAFSRSSFSV
eukprot:TRINITY_DN11841_c0_g1_i1.p1 TRINITY_DN11841_c0_g1~~TRINITY_DN11841_c0_g1_i1.p1  ORF type:complete len:119 (+),score=0.90 TRINITY_DN11841_c0_g1_i1:197-553(+)